MSPAASRFSSLRASSEHTSAHSTRSRNEQETKRCRRRGFFGRRTDAPARHTLHGGSRASRRRSFHRSLHDAVRHSFHAVRNSLHAKKAEQEAKRRGSSRDPSKAALRKEGGKYAKKTCAKAFEHSRFEDKSGSLPQFKFEELHLGKVLGKGGFGTVREVRSVSVKGDAGALEHRKFIAQHCFRSDGHARYAVKYLRSEVLDDPAMFIQGITDMAIETRFLSTVQHPHIIKMRAVANEDRFGERHFILIDRLYDTLEKRVEKWGTKARRSSSLVGKVSDRDGKKKSVLLQERIVAAYELSSAFKYLHDRKILYRDIKSENIGFDVRGDIKLFDFGLAKEITSEIEASKTEDGTYLLTGDTGSLRYMAPEVAQSQPYNEKCDVYSFAILLWEILACKIPFELYSPTSIKENVHRGVKRPQIVESWPENLKLLLMRGWTADIDIRSTMNDVELVLRNELVRLRDGDESGLDQVTRRSTFVFCDTEIGDLDVGDFDDSCRVDVTDDDNYLDAAFVVDYDANSGVDTKAMTVLTPVVSIDEVNGTGDKAGSDTTAEADNCTGESNGGDTYPSPSFLTQHCFMEMYPTQAIVVDVLAEPVSPSVASSPASFFQEIAAAQITDAFGQFAEPKKRSKIKEKSKRKSSKKKSSKKKSKEKLELDSGRMKDESSEHKFSNSQGDMEEDSSQLASSSSSLRNSESAMEYESSERETNSAPQLRVSGSSLLTGSW